METSEDGFHRFSHGHEDLVLAVDYNFYGTRMATASSDHYLKVWDYRDSKWTVSASWPAHEAEITDVRARRTRSSDLQSSSN